MHGYVAIRSFVRDFVCVWDGPSSCPLSGSQYSMHVTHCLNFMATLWVL